jgi:type I restriction enzyme S subunit
MNVRYLTDAIDHVTAEAVRDGSRFAAPGTVLIVVRSMTLGSRLQVALTVREVAFNQDIKAIRPAPGLLPEFLAYSLWANEAEILGLVDEASHGTKRLRTDLLGAFEIPIPEIAEQRRIVRVLQAVDGKIDVNRRISETLERFATALFRDWFAGWEGSCSTPVADLCAAQALMVGDGYRAKNDEMAASGVPFVRAGNVHSDVDILKTDLLGVAGVERAKEKVAVRGDAFFTSKGTVGRVGRVSRWTPRFVYSPQISFWRALDRDTVLPDFLYLWFGTEEFCSQRDAVKAQTDMAEYVSLRDQRAMQVSLPPIEEQRTIAQIVSPMIDRAAVARAECKVLAGVRDALLPELISGRISVSDDVDEGEAA